MIKHSLQYYVKRPNATINDIEEESRLLVKVENEVQLIKDKHGIGGLNDEKGGIFNYRTDD